MRSLQWSQPNTTGLEPPLRWLPQIALLNDTMYVWGGQCAALFCDDRLFALDLLSYDWSVVPTLPVDAGFRPTPRSGAIMEAMRNGSNTLVLHGGFDLTILSDTWLYHGSEQMWQRAPLAAASPPAPARYLAVGTVYGDALLVFGGETRTSSSVADLWRLDFRTWMWHLIGSSTTAAAWPPRRVLAGGLAWSHNKWLLHGGLNDAVGLLADAWCLDFVALTWTSFGDVNRGSSQVARERAAFRMAAHDGIVFVLPGANNLAISPSVMLVPGDHERVVSPAAATASDVGCQFDADIPCASLALAVRRWGGAGAAALPLSDVLPSTLRVVGLNAIIDAVLQKPLVLRGGAAQTATTASNAILDCQGQRCFTINGIASFVELVGLTVVNGSASEDGGAFAVVGSKLRLSDVQLLAHRSGRRGGVIALTGSSTLVARNCTFVANQAALAGSVVFARASIVTISDCVFEANELRRSSEGDGGSGVSDLEFVGGTLFVSTSIVSITGTRFVHNAAILGSDLPASRSLARGGALFALYSEVSVEESSFEANACELGGAVSLLGISNSLSELTAQPLSHARIIGCVFIGNAATVSGGALHVELVSLAVVDSLFMNNTAVLHGGVAVALSSGLAVANTSLLDHIAGTNGGALFLVSSVCRMEDVVMQRNMALQGGGGAVYWERTATAADDAGAPTLLRTPDTGTNHAAYGHWLASNPLSLVLPQDNGSAWWPVQRSGASLTPPVSVSLRDAYGQVTTNVYVAVSVISSSELSGSLIVAAAAGHAVFDTIILRDPPNSSVSLSFTCATVNGSPLLLLCMSSVFVLCELVTAQLCRRCAELELPHCDDRGL